jgi:hypothetical protein
MLRWDPRTGPTWIHEIFVWDPHILVRGAHNSIVGFMVKIYVFSFYKSRKDINNDFLNYVFLISFINYIIQYFSSNFVQLQTTLCSNF